MTFSPKNKRIKGVTIMKITTNSILSFANEFKSMKWGAALDEAIEI